MRKSCDISRVKTIGGIRKGQVLPVKRLCGSPKDFLRTMRDFFRTRSLAPKLNHISKLSVCSDMAAQYAFENPNFATLKDSVEVLGTSQGL